MFIPTNDTLNMVSQKYKLHNEILDVVFVILRLFLQIVYIGRSTVFNY